MNRPGNTVPDAVDRQVEAAFERHKRGEVSFAAGVYRGILDRHPNHARALHYLGLAAQQGGDSGKAITLLERSIELDPADARAYNHLGLVHVALNDKRAAGDCFERGLAVDPDNISLLNSLANVSMGRDLLRAIALYRRAASLNPEAAFLAFNLAQALNEDYAFDEALRLYRRTVLLDPTHHRARHNLGILLEQQGRFGEAIEQYLAVQRADPRHVSSLANLISIRDFNPDPSLVRRAEEMLASPSAGTENVIKLHRGLGKHYDRVQAYDTAFAHFRQAKQILKRDRPAFDKQAVASAMRRLSTFFDRAYFANDHVPVTDTRRPIFIVGLPRSGTTLTEQILASHPRVFGAGELQNIPKLVKSLRPDYPECLEQMDGDELARMAASYLDALDKLAGPEPSCVTDKMPVNALHLGLIATLFPDAHIIYCRRDPMDIAISCFVELFELEHDYTTDFEEFGHYFLEHERLMAHWRAVLPTPIHEVRYEDLVADPEAASRALIRFCGLEWDPACLEFQKTDRTVQTPSRWQVRQPIYRTSAGRWRHYASHIEPLAHLLASHGYSYAARQEFEAATSLPARQHSRRDSLPASLESPLFIVAAPRSGSTLLFETLARSAGICTVGGEAHWLVENVPDLRPGAPGVESNRLGAHLASAAARNFIVDQIGRHLVDETGSPIAAGADRTFLEKTPKNALRIPFFDGIFAKARFIFLWRDPRENVSSIMEAWRSGRFVTYKNPPGFTGPWSLMLPPGYGKMNGRPLEEIAAFQWESANRTIMEDLAALDPARWTVVDYGELVSDPLGTVTEILSFAGIPVDPVLAAHIQRPLPLSRYTQTAPAAGKWRVNEAEIERVLPGLADVWAHLEGFGRNRRLQGSRR